MKTAPLKVLLLGWDAPTEAAPPIAALLQALAPRADLTLVLPTSPEPDPLAALIQTTGLANLTAAELARLAVRPAPAPAETWQWPATPYLGATSTQAPAAPYIGRAADSAIPLNSPAPLAGHAAPPKLLDGEVAVNEAAALAAGAIQPQLNPAPLAGEATATQCIEAPALSQSTTGVPTQTSGRPTAALPTQNSVLDVAQAALQLVPTDGASLNFRVIQYARLATQLAASQEFAVIYAADWQSWLAAMEIRQLTGKPLVLHVRSLAQQRNTPADRGWVMELERVALRRADLVLTATAALTSCVLEHYELAAPRVRHLDAANQNPSPDLLAETILAALREVS